VASLAALILQNPRASGTKRDSVAMPTSLIEVKITNSNYQKLAP